MFPQEADFATARKRQDRLAKHNKELELLSQVPADVVPALEECVVIRPLYSVLFHDCVALLRSFRRRRAARTIQQNYRQSFGKAELGAALGARKSVQAKQKPRPTVLNPFTGTQAGHGLASPFFPRAGWITQRQISVHDALDTVTRCRHLINQLNVTAPLSEVRSPFWGAFVSAHQVCAV